MMKFADKVVGYMPVGQSMREDVSGGSFLVRAGKQEIAYRKVTTRGSLLFRFCTLAAIDPVVRMIVFQKPVYEFTPSNRNPLIVKYPALLSKDDSFVSGLGSSSAVEAIKREHEDATKVVKSSETSILFRLIRILFEDETFRSRVMTGKTPTGQEAEDLLNNAFDNQMEQILEIIDEFMDAQKAQSEVLEELNPLLGAIRNLPIAIHNHEILACASGHDIDPRYFADAMAKIGSLGGFKVACLSICLECRLRNNLTSSITVEAAPRSPRVRTKCDKCSGETIMSVLSLGIPSEMVQVFHENVIQEFVLGFAIATSPAVRNVYVRKKISPIINGNERSGREVDIMVISERSTAVAVEVTTTHRSFSIHEKAIKKEELFSDLPIDHLIYVCTDTSTEEPLQISEDTTILGPGHIPSIGELIESLL
ncbi:MAG: hypothetical protein ACTSUH_12275 [Candidatus Thorarchaeota archaeon]